MPKISIISTIYNNEKYINDFLNSIINQTFNDYEVILIDDGSTDNSKDIIMKYVNKDNRFKYYYQNNKGASLARNNGLEKASGEFLYLVDSDDIVLPNTLKIFMDNINPFVDILIANYQTIDKDNTIIKNNYPFLTRIKENSKSDFMFAIPFSGNKLYRSTVIKDNKINFSYLKVAEDVNFYLKVLPYVKGIKYIKENVLLYRISCNSLSHTYNYNIFDVVNGLFLVENEYKKLKLSKIYLENLELLKLNHYYFQFSKIIYFNKESKKKIYKFFKKYFYELKIKDTKNFNKFKKRYYLYLLRIYLGFIFNNKKIYFFFKRLYEKQG